jgi:hypothetical protein
VGNETTAIAMDQWYDTRNTKTYLFNPSDVKQEPKVISDRNYQDIYGDPEFWKQSKRIWNPSFSNRKQQLIFLGDGFTKKGNFRL